MTTRVRTKNEVSKKKVMKKEKDSERRKKGSEDEMVSEK
jgi:hypothetical protein